MPVQERHHNKAVLDGTTPLQPVEHGTRTYYTYTYAYLPLLLTSAILLLYQFRKKQFEGATKKKDRERERENMWGTACTVRSFEKVCPSVALFID